MSPRARICPALSAVLEGLKLARRELAASEADAPRRRWVSVALVSALHRPDEAKNPPVNEAFRSVLQVLQQVCLTHPPFPVKEHGVMLALIRDEISALQRALAPIG